MPTCFGHIDRRWIAVGGSRKKAYFRSEEETLGGEIPSEHACVESAEFLDLLRQMPTALIPIQKSIWDPARRFFDVVEVGF